MHTRQSCSLKRIALCEFLGLTLAACASFASSLASADAMDAVKSQNDEQAKAAADGAKIENKRDLAALYYAGTTNGWTHESMTYDASADAWHIDVVFSGHGDANGPQRFKVSTTPDWTDTVYGTSGGSVLCSDRDKCADVRVGEVGTYRLIVGDSTLEWKLAKLNNAAPIADFGAVADKKSVVFSDRSADADGDKLSYSWNFGDGAASSESNPVHVYEKDGNYEVVLSVSDGTLSSSKAAIVAVSSVKYDPVVSAMYFAGTTNDWTHQAMEFDHATGEWKIALKLTGKGDRGGAQRFKVSTSPNWHDTVYGKAGSNQLCANQALCGDIEISQVGDYILAVNDASLTWRLEKFSDENQSPSAEFSFDADKGTVRFKNLSSDRDGDILTYTWQFGDGWETHDVNPVHRYEDEGEYKVQLIASDGKSHEVLAAKTVTVSDMFEQPTRKALYFSGSANGWTHEKMSFDKKKGEWLYNISEMDKGDSKGGPRFKIASGPDWKGTVWGDAGNGTLCSDKDKCKDVPLTDKEQIYPGRLYVDDKTLAWRFDEDRLCGVRPVFAEQDGNKVSIESSLGMCNTKYPDDPNWYAFDFGDGTPMTEPVRASTKVTHEYADMLRDRKVVIYHVNGNERRYYGEYTFKAQK